MARITKRQIEIMKEATKRVRAGIKALDTEFGRDKWLTRIDISTLNVGSSAVCICGQLFGDYANAEFKKLKGWQEKDEKGFDAEKSWTSGNMISDDWAAKHGFYILGEEDFDYDLLTQLWYVNIFKMKVEAGLLP